MQQHNWTTGVYDILMKPEYEYSSIAAITSHINTGNLNDVPVLIVSDFSYFINEMRYILQKTNAVGGVLCNNERDFRRYRPNKKLFKVGELTLKGRIVDYFIVDSKCTPENVEMFNKMIVLNAHNYESRYFKIKLSNRED